MHCNTNANGSTTGESHDAYKEVTENEHNESSLSHELLAGGAAFAGFKAFEDHQRKEGKPVKHAFAKEVLAGFAAAEVDKLAETKGADWYIFPDKNNESND